MSTFVRRLGATSARRPWVTIGAWALLVALILALAGSIGGAFTDDLSAPGSQSARAMELLEERFPEAAGGSALAVFAAPDGTTVEEGRDAIDTALDEVRATEHVTAVADPFAAGTVSADGRVAFAEITFDEPATELGPDPPAAAYDALAAARDAGLQAELGGDAAFINAEAEPAAAEAIGLVVALVVLVVAFGTVVAALVPISLALVAVASGLGGIALLANAMDVSTSAPTIAAMIGLGVGIDYALFVVARYQELRRSGTPNDAALVTAMSTSGSAVLFAGGTVVIAMLALVLTGLGFLASIGIATSLVVLLAVAAALTLLPAILTLLGDRIDRLRVRGRHAGYRDVHDTGWWRFAHRVSARPLPYLVVASAVLVALALPALSMETGFPDAGDDPTTMTHRRAYDLLSDGFGPGFNAPLLLVADLQEDGVDEAGLDALAADVVADPGVAFVGAPMVSPAGDTVVLPTIPTTAPADPATADTLARVRADLPDNVAVAGLTAMTDDLTTQLDDTLPLFIGAILLVSILLLMIVFRSIAVPLKAALMNLLSIGGAYGVVVAVFQWGWGASLLGLEGTVVVASPLPVMFFAVLFGLSMDYEVFLLSRIREEYTATGDNAESVARGISATGRVITSAALIMTAVFGAFFLDPSPLVRMVGLGLATAILLDATIVRMVIVPASMALMGRANWWLPGWLDRILPHASIEGAPVDVTVPATPAGLGGPSEPTEPGVLTGSRR
ncbi:MMPL family transporter [Salsipaludibacter albus]|uniref:MMPL family transporter n=1 Tax=Salsipaludibacter albus TaxID=2849650 RepID=UPI001EE3BC87|nr:MMPL family transporter [Salsipaludibacter albus]MBY5162076.1 MMPL family transporter [Salsipaludibacter albus]